MSLLLLLLLLLLFFTCPRGLLVSDASIPSLSPGPSPGPSTFDEDDGIIRLSSIGLLILGLYTVFFVPNLVLVLLLLWMKYSGAAAAAVAVAAAVAAVAVAAVAAVAAAMAAHLLEPRV